MPIHSLFYYLSVGGLMAVQTKAPYTKKGSQTASFSAVRRGLEPLTPCVTGTYSNQLN